MGVTFKYSESFPKEASPEARDTMRIIHRIVNERLAEEIARKLNEEKKKKAV